MDEIPAVEPPPGVTPNFENPEDVLATVNVATQYLSIVIVTIFVAVRCFLKIRLHRKFDLEDYATVAGWALFLGWCACMLLLGKYGGGYNAWEVPAYKMTNFSKVSYAITIVYVLMAVAVKIALLGIMTRIFAPDRRKVITIYTTLAIILAYYTPALFIKIFFCKPISAYWDGTDGKCFNQQKVIMADSVISIITDFWILILPLPMLWSLHMSKSKKMRVTGVLGAGGLATAFSVWRLVITVQVGSSTNTTYAFIKCVLTGNAEAGIGLICACLPMMSSYYSSLKTKSQNKSQRSYLPSNELDSWGKISTRFTKSKDNPNFTTGSADQAHLISTAEGATTPELVREGSTTSARSVRGKSVGGIQKSVTVSQNFEFVK